ncbi:PIR protein [Plasmodium malariae]|uniref:PIR protein n=1 Tax=Plasmodium malariae TaxID=5858 RepID=A0A1D3JHS0_PLAMA|nr:PIR protein [Plasmodium malariae]SBT85940.1 PIR protein [Plasmodium malariae]
MSTVLPESFIESLPSKIYYRTKFESNNKYCLWFDEEGEFSEKRSKLNHYGKIKNVTDKLTSALCSVAFTNEGVECKEKCRNLYYWLGNELLLSDIEENLFSDVIGILEDVSNVLYKSGKCKCTFFKNVTKENFAKMKIVYDYCVDHEKIEQSLKVHSNMCDSKFNAYLVKADSTYKDVYVCAQNNTESYCTQLKNHAPSCFNEKLSHLTCKINRDSKEEQGSNHFGTNYFDLTYVINASNFSSSQIFLFFVLPLIGIFFIGFLLYKFTPIVPWIHTKVLKKKSIRRNLDEMDILELTEYTNERRRSNLGRIQLNVAYHAA